MNKFGVFCSCIFLYILLASPPRLFSADYDLIKDDIPKAAEYLSGHLVNDGEGTRYNKYDDPNGSEIPAGVKETYKKTLTWDPSASSADYVQCTAFVNEVFRWQYPDFPENSLLGHAKSYLNASKKDGFTVYKNKESTDSPRPGDILVWDYGTLGHVAVVGKVDESFFLLKTKGGTIINKTYGYVTYFEANMPTKTGNRIYYYDENKNIYFAQRDTVPAGWVRWNRTNYQRNQLILKFMGCPSLSKQDKEFWEKLISPLHSLTRSMFQYECQIYVEPRLLDKQMSSLGGGTDKSTARENLREQIEEAQKIFENYQKTVNDLSSQFQDKTLIMDSLRLEEELVKMDKLIKALESYLDQLSRLSSLATGTTAANYQKLLLDFISQTRELTELVKSAYSLLAFQKDYLRDFEQLRSQINTVSQKLSQNESTVNELSQLVSKAIEKEDQLIKRLREQNVRPELKKMVDIEIRGLTEERQLLLDFNTALDNQDVDFLLSFGQKYNDFLQRFITEAPTGMDDFNQSASKIIQSLSAISTQIAAKQSTLIGR